VSGEARPDGAAAEHSAAWLDSGNLLGFRGYESEIVVEGDGSAGHGSS
jgi:hypothetical protein